MKTGLEALWPDTKKPEGALVAIQQAFWAALFLIAITSTAIAIGLYETSALFDVSLFSLGAIGLAYRSRTAAILLTALYIYIVIAGLITQIAAGQIQNNFFMNAIITAAFINGIRGTIAVHSLPNSAATIKENDDVQKRIHRNRRSNIIGIAVICLFVSSVYFVLPEAEREEFRNRVDPPVVITDSTQSIRITVPRGWYDTSEDNPEALFKLEHTDYDLSLFASSDLQKDLEKILGYAVDNITYNRLVQTFLNKDLQDSSITEPVPIMVDAQQGIMTEARGIAEGIPAFLRLITFEHQDRFYRILFISAQADLSEQEETIAEALNAISLLN